MVENERKDERTGDSGGKSPKKLRVLLRTFGCQMNARDSELIAGMLAERGFEIVDSEGSADIILFNTCSVRQHAEERVWGAIGRAAKMSLLDSEHGTRRIKTAGTPRPAKIVGLVGCMAQNYGEEIFKRAPNVDLVVGPNNIYDIPDLLTRMARGEKVLAVNNVKRPLEKIKGDKRNGVFSAFVNIMYGCDNFCSYCIVPHVRGREVSRPKRDILDEIKGLIDNGFKEVTLLGQNVNSYGKGLNNKTTFPELLESVNSVKGIERIRFTTSHPKDAGKTLFRAMRDLDKVCEHIHLPLQSASNRILDLMNRKYTYEDYRKKTGLLREIVPDAAISTDIIAGFPSEKDKDFNGTKNAMEEIEFNSAFIFKYSPRPPALSSKLVDDIPEEEKKRRNNELLALQKKISLMKNKAMIGTEQEVLVEGKSRMSDKEHVGRIRNNTPCVLKGDAGAPREATPHIGQIVRVKIVGASPGTLKGEIVC